MRVKLLKWNVPHCGGLVGPQHKNELNRAALSGRGGWLHEAESGGELVPLNDSKIRGSEIASWALNGAAATFAKWSELVSRRLVAERALETLGDEVALARYYYTDVGIPYARKVDKTEGELSVQFLKDNLREAERGVAPSWTRFVVISVDVQGSYFPVQITAFGEDGKAQVVDRFDLTQRQRMPPIGAVATKSAVWSQPGISRIGRFLMGSRRRWCRLKVKLMGLGLCTASWIFTGNRASVTTQRSS